MFWIRLELISFKIEQNKPMSDWLAHSGFKKNVEKRWVWGWISAKKKVKNMFTRSTAGENTFACVFNNMMMFECCSQWCVMCCYSFFLCVFPIGPNRSRSVQRFFRSYKTVTNGSQIDINTAHIYCWCHLTRFTVAAHLLLFATAAISAICCYLSLPHCHLLLFTYLRQTKVPCLQVRLNQ